MKVSRGLTVWHFLSVLTLAAATSLAAMASETPRSLGAKSAAGVVEAEPARSAPAPVTFKEPLPVGNLYLVFFAEESLATYAGDILGLEATSPAATGARKLDSRSPASVAYLEYLDEQQEQHTALIEQALSRPIEVVFRYRAAGNGIAASMSPAEAKIVSGLEGVLRVLPDRVAPLHTDRGPAFIGAPSIWDGSATGGLPGTMGEGVIVGVIDSGVNMDHPSFAEVGGDGFIHTNPFGDGVFVGWCDPANPNHDPSYVCNDKLVGAWDFTDAFCAANPGTCSENDGPEDNNGHGSHTASTVAGNVLLSPAISGVAPHANVITYDGCYLDAGGQGLCPFSATSAGVDQAVLDGVDATNYSISGGTNPWGGDIDTFFLNAVAAGIYAAASAGNAGPGPNTTAHLGPWMSTTGASTHDVLTVENQLVDMAGGGIPPGDITGASRTAGYGPATIVYAGDFANGDVDPEQCLNPFPAATWVSGEIVLCDRGTIARLLKCANVAAGGAAGCVLANANAGQTTPVPDPHVIPAIHVDLADGDTLRTWLALGVGHEARITDSVTILDPAVGDIMAGFSSRGPNPFNVLKPDLTAPGVNIIAAWSSGTGLPPPEFAVISGTSQSGPHNAGSGALMSALIPAWSPAETKSAIMMTAETSVLKEDGATPADPFDFGGGRIDLTKAALVGLVLDETAANFLAADPAVGGDPGDLNLPSHQERTCVIDCTWSRTVKSVASSTLGWTVSSTTPAGMTLNANPSAFSLPAGATQVIDFTADGSGLPLGVFAFAEIQLTEPGASPDLHLPVAIQPALDNFPEIVNIKTLDDSGTRTLAGLEAAVAITDLDVQPAGLVQGTDTEVVLFEDPTNGNPYDDLGQVFFNVVNVPEAAPRLTAITESDEAPDVDLYVGTGLTPDAGSQVCASTSPEASERCDIFDPTPGFWWVLVQNWAGSANQPDLIQLVDVVVPNVDVGNLSATGPAITPAGQPFDLDVSWNEPAMKAEQFWFGSLAIGTDSGNPGNLGSIGVDIEILGPIFADGFESGDTSAWSNTVP